MNRQLRDLLWAGLLLILTTVGGGLYAGPTPQPDRFPPSSPFAEPPLALQLNVAAAQGDVARVVDLLGAGVSPDAVMADTGMTALMVVADARVARVLIRAGADVRRTDTQGWAPLHHAVTRPGSAGLVAVLLHAGADAGKRDERGETPLLRAGLLFTEAIDRSGGVSVLNLLVQQGRSDINACDRDGWTLLHQAASNDEPALAGVCLALGAGPDIRTPLRETPFEMAKRLHAHGFLEALGRFRGGKEK